MRIEMVSMPGTPGLPNEDFAGVDAPAGKFSGAALVLDGVTPPADGRTGCAHTVSWYTTQLGGALLALAAGRPDLSLADCLAEAIARTATAHGPGCDLTHVRTPQATVAALRWHDDHVEHLVLSDAAVLLRAGDGTVTPVLDDRLDVLMRRPEIHALRTERRALEPGSAAHAEVSRVLSRAVEALRNVDGGFFTAAADPEVAGRAVTGTLPRAALHGACVATDGVTRFTDVFRLGDWTTLLTRITDDGAQSVVDQVRAAESADPHGEKFPRGKPSDDASVAYVEF